MTIHCPACQGEIQVTDDFLGEALACPHCDHLFQLTPDGDVAEYVAPAAASGGGGSKKTAIIAISVAVVVVGGFVALLLSGGNDDPTPKVAQQTPAQADPQADPQPAPSTGGDGNAVAAPGGEVAPLPGPIAPPANMNDLDAMGDANVSEFLGLSTASAAPIEPKPPVEIPDTPDGTITAVMGAMADGNPRGIWDALPASYQTEINGLVRESAEVVDPVMWDKGFAVAGRVAKVLNDKQDFIFGNQMVAGMMASNPQAAEIKTAYPKIIGLLTTILTSDISNRDKLKQFDGGQFLGTTGAQLIDNIAGLAALSPTNTFTKDLESMKNVSVKILNNEGGTAEVEISAPGQTNKVEKMTQVEGRWIPAEMAADWENFVKEARAGLEQQKAEKQQAGMQAQMMLGMVEGVLAQFESAKTQQDFDMALQGIMGMAMGMGGGPGGPGGMPGGPPPGFGPTSGANPNMGGGTGQFPPPQNGQRPPMQKQ